MAAKKKTNPKGGNAPKKAKSAPKKKAPVPNTGGKGFSFEDAVAARFMLDMLGQTNALGVAEFGRVTRLDWQARDTGWLFDDLVITCFDGKRSRAAGASIKSGQSVTTEGFPIDFARLLWFQVLGMGTAFQFAGTEHVALFATGAGTAEAKPFWQGLLDQAINAAPERLVARIKATTVEGPQFSAEARKIFNSLKCPADVHTAAPDELTAFALRQVRWLDFGYERAGSQAYGDDIALCKAILAPSEAHKAADLLDALLAIAKGFRTAGGTLQLPTLLTALKGKFTFKDHPDYAGDWEALTSRADAELSIIQTSISGLPQLDRAAELKELQSSFESTSACFLLGDSGSGKTALAKQFAAQYAKIIWLNGSSLDYASLPDLQRALGLTHPVSEVIGGAVPVTLVVVDAIEGFSPNAKKVLAQLISTIRKSPASSRAHFLLTAQLESATGLVADLASLGVENELLKPTVLNKPTVEDVAKLVGALPNVKWVALNQELRGLLTNLKMLDWFVRFSQSGGQIATSVVGLTNLIDALWEHWIARGAEGPARADLLKQVAAIEADQLLASVPASKLGHAEQVTLGSLPDNEFLRRRDERVQFSHDLLGDWARLRVLIGDDWIMDEAKRERFTMPKWFRAVRLYGQRLLEKSDDAGAEWQKHLELVGDKSTTGKLVRDLYLEALFLAPNATALLRQAWPVLTANRAALLKVLLKRFLYVATLPDPRLSLLLGPDVDSTKFEHLMRFPYWPLWGPVFTVLLENLQDTVNLVPHETAKLCALWLRSMNWEVRPGSSIRWRTEAAQLAVAVARQIQVNAHVREPFSSAGSKEIYEALFLAGAELPAEVGQLLLEFCNRREISDDAKKRIYAALKKEEEEKAKARPPPAPKKRRPPPSVMSFRGERREPWPDGPSERIDHYLIDATLDGVSFVALAKANPDAAVEILLATCIEDPQYEEFGSSVHEETGLHFWNSGGPPIWYRGPFYQFFQVAPGHALTFVLKLINFTTERCNDGQHANLQIAGAEAKWLGDSNTFTWHYDGHLWKGEIAQSALMALEKWLYDQLDAGKDIEPALQRVMSESRSLAFAGLLIMVGKRKPELFLTVLSPLLSIWHFVNWDLQLTLHRTSGYRGILGSFSFKPPNEIEAAQKWAALPHRNQSVRDVAALELLPLEQNAPFFNAIVDEWSKDLSEDRKPLELRRLIESLTRSSFEFAVVNGKLRPVKFRQTPEDEAEDAALRANAASELTTLNLPFHCRKLLNDGTPFAVEQVSSFFDIIKSQHNQAVSIDDLRTTADVVLAGVAVLICLNSDWLVANPDAMKWCVARLNEYINTPPGPAPFYSDYNHGNDKADAFAGEAGLALLARNSDDKLARRLVASAVTGRYYSTTQLVAVRTAENAKALGDDFLRILALGLGWAAIRPCLNMFRQDDTTDFDRWVTRRQGLLDSFVDKTLPAKFPDLMALNIRARTELKAIHAKQHPDHAKFLENKEAGRIKEGGRVKLYTERFGFDERLVGMCLGWLTPTSTGAFSRQEALGIIRQLMNLVLDDAPKVAPGDDAEIDGLPNEFDGWVFENIAKTIPVLAPNEDPELFWKPLLSLGPPGHQWIERFYWQWFTLGFGANAEQFFIQWKKMIEVALNDPAWDPKANWHHRIDDAMFELLGFDARWSKWLDSDLAPKHVGKMGGLFERVAQKWFSLPKILTGWVQFAQRKAVGDLALKSLPWIEVATKDYHDYDWRYGTEESLIEFLSSCWLQWRDRIVADDNLRTSFMAMMKMLAARGSHPALALQQRIVG